jgi:hypothetical protein
LKTVRLCPHALHIPIPLPSAAGTRWPYIRVSPDDDDLITLAWDQHPNSSNTDHDIYFEFSTDGGDNWSSDCDPISTVDTDYLNWLCKMEMDSDSNTYVVWENTEKGTTNAEVHYIKGTWNSGTSTYSFGSVGTVVTGIYYANNLHPMPEIDIMEYSGSTFPCVVYNDRVSGVMERYYIDKNGGSWGSSSMIFFGVQANERFGFRVNELTSSTHEAFCGFVDSGTYKVYRSGNSGSTWSNFDTTGDSSGNSYTGDLELDDSANVHVFYHDVRLTEELYKPDVFHSYE